MLNLSGNSAHARDSDTVSQANAANRVLWVNQGVNGVPMA
jgi:hypothetical protein